MAKRVRKAVKYGASFLKKAKARLEKEVKALIKAGLMDKGEARKILKAFVKEAKAEKERFAAFAAREIKKEVGKAKKHAKPLMKRAVKRFKSRYKR